MKKRVSFLWEIWLRHHSLRPCQGWADPLGIWWSGRSASRGATAHFQNSPRRNPSTLASLFVIASRL